MNRMKLLTIAAIAILTAGALTSVAAQKRGSVRVAMPVSQLAMDPVIDPAVVTLSGTYTTDLDAVELSPGETEYAMAETYGWTCYGKTTGDLSGFMFISMNYSLPAHSAPPNEIQTEPRPPVPIEPTSTITGGSWSKLIFVDGQYAGSVHGRIVGGTMTWSKTDLSTQISMDLSADDGTGSFAGNVGTGTFVGVLDHSPKGSGGNITGKLKLQY